MPDVPKNVAASASTVAIPLGRRTRAEEERDLVRLAQSGTEAAFEELIRRHQQRVLALVGSILRRREDVEDVAQQVFLKVFISLKRFDLRSAFSTWLYKITVNECWDYLRKKKVRPLVYEADLSEEQVSRLDGIVSADRPVSGASEQAEVKETLEWMLEKLPEQDQQLLVLKEMEGFSVQELAEILDLNVNTVKVRLFRARSRLMDVYRRRTSPAVRNREATQQMLKGRVENMGREYQKGHEYQGATNIKKKVKAVANISSSACPDYEALLEDSISGEIGGADALRLSEHLKTCAGCREAREHVALTPRLLHLAEATADPGPGFSRDVMARIRTDRDVRSETRILAAARFDGMALRRHRHFGSGCSRRLRHHVSRREARSAGAHARSRSHPGYVYSRSGARSQQSR